MPIGVFGRLRLLAETHDGDLLSEADGGRARWCADGALQRAEPDRAAPRPMARPRSTVSDSEQRPLFLLRERSAADRVLLPG